MKVVQDSLSKTLPQSLTLDRPLSFYVDHLPLSQQGLDKIYHEKTTVNHVSIDPEKEAERLECSLSAYDSVLPTIQFIEPVRKEKRTISTSFKSVCAHHTFPFFGTIDISYNGFQIKPDSL